MSDQDLAILYSGGRDSTALLALAICGGHREIPAVGAVHLLHMLNGMSRFHDFPRRRFERTLTLLEGQWPADQPIARVHYLELDMGRLFQGFWLDHYEDLMVRFGGKNLVCVACKLGMHIRAILYCLHHHVPLLLVGYASRQAYYPEQTEAFMQRLADFSSRFGVTTRYPLFQHFEDVHTARHLLEDLGLPSTGGGERKCLFCQTKTTATEKETSAFLEAMLPRASEYIEHKLSGNIQQAAACFPPGNRAI